jgi:preprotein translocase subunit SecB
MRRRATPKPHAKLDQTQWERWAQHVEIREVSADTVDFRVNRARLAAREKAPVNIKYRMDSTHVRHHEGEMTLGFEFELIMSEGKATRPPDKALVRVLMAYHATYLIPPTPAITEVFVKRFHERIAAAHAFPFVRAHLADLIMRAGLPPLYLPLAHPSRKGQDHGDE